MTVIVDEYSVGFVVVTTLLENFAEVLGTGI